MTFNEALKKLNIEDYGERIFNSNSHGELFYLCDYAMIAEFYAQTNVDASEFRPWFVKTVAWAEKNWQRPESIFQHIPRCMQESIRS